MSKSSWQINTAKHQLAEVIRRSRSEPQRIYNRSQLVAAVVNPDVLGETQAAEDRQAETTLAELFAEFRVTCAREGFEFPNSERRNRSDSLAATLD